MNNVSDIGHTPTKPTIKQVASRLCLVLIMIGILSSCINFGPDFGPWTDPYESYNSGVKVNGVEYHIARADHDRALGGETVDDMLRIDFNAPMNSRNNPNYEDRVVFYGQVYIDSVAVSTIELALNDMTNLDTSSIFTLLRCFERPELYGRIEVPFNVSFVNYCNKSYTVKNGSITFKGIQSLWAINSRTRTWKVSRCEFECVAVADDGEEIVLTDGFF